MSVSLDQQITDYLALLNDKQKQAVLGVVRTFAEGPLSSEHWSDDGFVNEMNSRYQDFKSGGGKASSLDEIEASAKAAIKDIPRK